MTDEPPPRAPSRETWTGMPFPRTATSLRYRCPVREDDAAKPPPAHWWRRLVVRLLVYPPLLVALAATVALAVPLQGRFFAQLLERAAADAVRGLDVRVGSARIDAAGGVITLQTVVVVDRESGATWRLRELDLLFDPFEIVATRGVRGLSELRVVAGQRVPFVADPDRGWTIDESLEPIARRLLLEARRWRAQAERARQSPAGDRRARLAFPDVAVTGMQIVARRTPPGAGGDDSAPSTTPHLDAADVAGARALHAPADHLLVDEVRWRPVAGRIDLRARLDDDTRRTPGELTLRAHRCGTRYRLEAALSHAMLSTLPVPVELDTLRLAGWITPPDAPSGDASGRPAATAIDITGSVERVAIDTSGPQSLRGGGQPEVAWSAGPLAIEFGGAATAARREATLTANGDGLVLTASLALDDTDGLLDVRATCRQVAPVVAALDLPAEMGLRGAIVAALEGTVTIAAQLATGPEARGGHLRVTSAEAPLLLTLSPGRGIARTASASPLDLSLLWNDAAPFAPRLTLARPIAVTLDDHHVATLDLDEAGPAQRLLASGTLTPSLIDHFAPDLRLRLAPATISGSPTWTATLPLPLPLPPGTPPPPPERSGATLAIDLAGLALHLPDKWMTAPVEVDAGRLSATRDGLALDGLALRLGSLVAALGGSLREGVLALDGTIDGNLASLEESVTDVRKELILDGPARGTVRVRAGTPPPEGGAPLPLAESIARVVASFRDGTHELHAEATAHDASVAHLSMPVLGRNLRARARYEHLAIVFDELRGDLGATRDVRGRGRLTFRPGTYPHLQLDIEADQVDLAEWLETWHRTPQPPPDVLAARTVEKRFELDVDVRMRRWRAIDPFSTGLYLTGPRGAARLRLVSSVGPGRRSVQRLDFLPGTRLDLHGGHVAVTGALDLPNARNPTLPLGAHAFVVRAHDIDLAGLATELRREPSPLRGRLSFEAFVRGPLDPPDAAIDDLDGAIRVRIRRSNLLAVPYVRGLLEAVGLRAPSADGSADLDGTILLDRGRAWSSNILLHHPVVALLFQGTAGLRRGELSGRMLVRVESASYYDAPVLSQIMTAVGAAIDDVSNLLVSFRLMGTLDKPRTAARPTAGMVDQLRALVGAEDIVPSSTNDVTTFPFRIPPELEDVDFSVRGAW